MTDDLAERVATVLARYAGPEHAELRALIAELVTGLERREAVVGSLTVRLGQLESAVTGLHRAGKRQAAPFYRGAPKANPKKPGRKSGEDYGPKAHRAVPQRCPDRELAAELPQRCPDCGGEGNPVGRGATLIPGGPTPERNTAASRRPGPWRRPAS